LIEDRTNSPASTGTKMASEKLARSRPPATEPGDRAKSEDSSQTRAAAQHDEAAVAATAVGVLV
jgi:hypothetical protein